MASSVTLELEDKSFEVLKCLCKCDQKFDQNGSPASGVSGGSISLLLAGTGEDDFASWIVDPTQTKSGTITFFIDGSSFKKIEFQNAFIVKLHESFYSEGRAILNRSDRYTVFHDVNENFIYEQVLDYQQRSGINYMIQCSISAGKISIDGVDHDNNW
jgi:hypothetical protein